MKKDIFKVSMYFAYIKQSVAVMCMMEISSHRLRCCVCKPGSDQLVALNSKYAVDFIPTQINALGQ